MFEGLNVRLFQMIHKGAGTDPFFDLCAIFFSETGPYILIAVFVLAWLRAGKKRKHILIETMEAAALSLVLNQLIGFYYFHPRPYMIGLCDPLILHSPETSFPSDHATFMFTAIIYLLVFNDGYSLGLLLLPVAVITAWGRVYSGIHFPFDMFGSLVVGVISSFCVFKGAYYMKNLNGWLVYKADIVSGKI